MSVHLPPFQQLVDAHWRDVARLAHALAGPDDGDDVAQQAWTQALAAYRAGGWLDGVVMSVAVAGYSTPVFVVGYLLVYVFSMQLQWFPTQGYAPLADGLGACLRSVCLPAPIGCLEAKWYSRTPT